MISISRTLPQVEALDATIIKRIGHTLMQIRVNVLGVSMTFFNSAAVHLQNVPGLNLYSWYVLELN
jgi:hypothetical protein